MTSLDRIVPPIRRQEPLSLFNEDQQLALRAAMEGRYSGRALHTFSAVELFELKATPQYAHALAELEQIRKMNSGSEFP